MNWTVLRSCAPLLAGLCLSAPPLLAAPAAAPPTDAQPARVSRDIDIDGLLRHWVHSFEEDQAGGTVRVFRPAGSMTFPPSRFRMAYKFARHGACEAYFLSPDDNHRFKPCHWTVSPGSPAILRISAEGETTSFRIVRLTEQILRLAPMAP